MKPIERSEILDYVTYGEQREAIRAAALQAKSERRILVGEHFTFLFENRETVRYQIQEMVRVERIVKEDDIEHEIKTYNELLHPAGTLGCTLMIAIDDEAERNEKLRAWLGLNDHIYATLPMAPGKAHVGPPAGRGFTAVICAVRHVRARSRSASRNRNRNARNRSGNRAISGPKGRAHARLRR